MYFDVEKHRGGTHASPLHGDIADNVGDNVQDFGHGGGEAYI